MKRALRCAALCCFAVLAVLRGTCKSGTSTTCRCPRTWSFSIEIEKGEHLVTLLKSFSPLQMVCLASTLEKLIWTCVEIFEACLIGHFSGQCCPKFRKCQRTKRGHRLTLFSSGLPTQRAATCPTLRQPPEIFQRCDDVTNSVQ